MNKRDPLVEFEKCANSLRESDWNKALLGSDSWLCQLARCFDASGNDHLPDTTDGQNKPNFGSAAVRLAAFVAHDDFKRKAKTVLKGDRRPMELANAANMPRTRHFRLELPSTAVFSQVRGLASVSSTSFFAKDSIQ